MIERAAQAEKRPTDAAGWDARLRAADCTDGERTAFRRWCAADSRNQQAFDRLQAMLEGLRQVSDRPEIRSLREAALDAASAKRGRWQRRAAAAALAAGVALVMVLRPLDPGRAPQAPSGSSYSTAVGERSTVNLADGTTAVLNTNTRLAIAYSAQERVVKLLRGQALFDVAADPARPFTVIAGEQRITAVGTVFDVRFAGDAVAVVLVEGVVDVVPGEPIATSLSGPAPEPRPVRLRAGQRLVTTAVAGPQTPVVETADVAMATMWRRGQVFFDDVPLSAAVAEMNRYSTTTIVVADAALDRHRVNGMFRTGHQASFVEALAAYFPLTVEREADGRIALRESLRD